jgi:predicted phosphohydrolase
MDRRVAIYAISDLHLSFNRSVHIDQIDPEKDIVKPMDIFGWDERYYDRVRDNWRKLISDQDTVLIPGDISWALKQKEALHDLNWISQLPGHKVLSPGNHEYYYHSKNKIRNILPANMEWLDADFAVVEEKVICATRGWTLPTDRFFDEEDDRKIYNRQVGRLQMSLESAVSYHPNKDIIVMLHYPPVNKSGETSGFWELVKQYNVKYCIYGHLHGKAILDAVEGEVDGIPLKLVSCDALDFSPFRIWS